MNVDQAAAVLTEYATGLRGLADAPDGWEAFFAAFVELRTQANRLQLQRTVPHLNRDVQVSSFTKPEHVRGLDGKTYPASRLSQADRAELAGFVHARCHEGMSVRRIVAILGEGFGVRRSVGWVVGVLREWRCPACVQVSGNHTPEQSGGGAA